MEAARDASDGDAAEPAGEVGSQAARKRDLAPSLRTGQVPDGDPGIAGHSFEDPIFGQAAQRRLELVSRCESFQGEGLVPPDRLGDRSEVEVVQPC
jgi:hypothetical protein